MIESPMTTATYTGKIMRLDDGIGQGYIQITPYLGFWLNDEHYAYISTRYKLGDTITLKSNTLTGFVTSIEEQDHETLP